MRQAGYALVALTSVLCLSARPGDPHPPPASTKMADFRLKDGAASLALADQEG